MIVTAHQPNFLPGMSVVEKVRRSDAVIWLDVVQWTKGGWTNRNRGPDGGWLTVPVAHGSTFAPINRVRIGRPLGDWRHDISRRLCSLWPGETTGRVCGHIERGYPLLVGLNAAILNVLLEDWQGEQHWQSHLDDAHAAVAVSESPVVLAPISERIAEMVAAVGGTTYLSGPSGRRYLDEIPFRERDIDVAYFDWAGDNPCALATTAAAAA